jgi:hypothetical protein
MLLLETTLGFSIYLLRNTISDEVTKKTKKDQEALMDMLALN